MTYTGRVMSVETRNVSEPTTAAAIIGATTLYVSDASTFDETGGMVTVLGEQLGYTGINVEDDSITLTAALTVAVDEQELVEVFPPTPVKTALVSLDDNGDSHEVVVPQALLDKFIDGTRDDANAESVTLERRGAYEWLIADAPAKQLEQASLDYVEGEVGYGLTESGVQVADLQATGEIGATSVSTGQVILAGENLIDILAPIPRSTRYASRGAVSEINAGNTSGTTDLRLFTFNAGPVTAGRLYEVGVRGVGNGTVVGDVFWVFLCYTLDGSEPTTLSPKMPGGAQVYPVITGNLMPINMPTTFEPATDGELRLAVVMRRRSGTGTAYVYVNNPDFRFTVYSTDLGLASDSSTALQQTAKVDGSGSDNPPETTKTFSIQPTHTEYYMGFGGRTGAADQTDIGTAQIGWQQDLLRFGNDRPDFSVFHFNHAAIVSALSTASSIVSVQLKFKVKSRAAAAGLDLSVFAHKYATFPHSMVGDYVTEVAAVGTNLKSGLYKGIGVTSTVFTAAGVGELFANPSVDRPTLIITYISPA